MASSSEHSHEVQQGSKAHPRRPLPSEQGPDAGCGMWGWMCCFIELNGELQASV